MPNVKTEVSARSKANVAYCAALLGETESAIYGLIIDMVADSVSAEQLHDKLHKRKAKGTGANEQDGSSTQ